MTFFGDVDIPWLIDKDTSIPRNIIEKNFVDSPPQVFDLPPSLEVGDYSAILNEKIHEREESFSEQKDAVHSMVDRHVTEFPFDIPGEEGHALVESASASVIPSSESREVELGIRFLDSNVYRPGIRVTPSSITDEFSVEPVVSVVPIPNVATNVEDESGTITSEFTLATEDGDLDLYEYTEKAVISHNRPSDFSSGERIGPVRLFSQKEGDRLYSAQKLVSADAMLSNKALRTEHGSTQMDVSLYDSSLDSWRTVGDIDISAGNGYIETNTNYETEISFVDGYNAFMFRGLPVVRVDIDGITSFNFNISELLTLEDDANDWYRVVSNESGDDLIVIRTSTDGSFNVDTGTDTVSVTGLDSSTEYHFFVGFVPGGVTNEQFGRYVFNRGIWNRTLVQK